MQHGESTAYAFRGQRPSDSDGSSSETEPLAQTRTGSAIACAACMAAITTRQHRIAVQGSHEHRFMNPAGLTFHIGCFQDAIGCKIVGPDSLEYAWFPGLAWRYALCASCGQHLGWHFRDHSANAGRGPLAEATSFFGLILDRLVQPPPEA